MFQLPFHWGGEGLYWLTSVAGYTWLLWCQARARPPLIGSYLSVQLISGPWWVLGGGIPINQLAFSPSTPSCRPIPGVGVGPYAAAEARPGPRGMGAAVTQLSERGRRQGSLKWHSPIFLPTTHHSPSLLPQASEKGEAIHPYIILTGKPRLILN